MGTSHAMSYPLRHVSIRVPWHDSGWKGTVCAAPHLNGACAKLKRIAEKKNDQEEMPIAGESFESLSRDKWPCCVDERIGFMAPFELEQTKTHALASTDPEHYGHFQPTRQRYPAYSAGVVPFKWLMKSELERIKDLYGLNVDLEREPELNYETTWIHVAENQEPLLDCFASHLKEEASLCLFYAKHVPFVEGTARVIVGVGRVRKVGKLTEYKRNGDGIRGMVWERPVQHSIRPAGGDGFLMPYLEMLERAAEDPSLDLEPYVAHAPSEHWNEFSYASELVTHDGAIASLLSVESALARMEEDLGIATGWQRQWVHDELVRLWKVRGPYPGLGAVLRAFGLSRGLYLAHALQHRAGENANPWPEVAKAFQNPESLPEELRRDLKELAPAWKNLPAKRRETLKLLSRFELDSTQAEKVYDEKSRASAGWNCTDDEVLQNPYQLYEISRHDPEGISLLTIDRGVFPDDSVRLLHPLEGPGALESGVDFRRIRAFTIKALEEASDQGHTLCFTGDLAEAIREVPVQPKCPATADILSAAVAMMEPHVVALGEGQPALQLRRYAEIGDLVRKNVMRRVEGKRHTLKKDWARLLDERFGPSSDDEETRARREKAASLAELAESRFSVLVGSAGTGKTTVLSFLCRSKEVLAEGLLLLAPTGKARVRMQQLAGAQDVEAYTVAQFLNRHKRYNPWTARYHLNPNAPKADGYGTVIIDEASMLTEDMLGALVDALQGVKRLVFVGDPSQLPPIGAGRPFVDIVSKLRQGVAEGAFPRVSKGYAELTVERRQVGAARPDLRFARWFSSTPPSAGEDDVFSFGDQEHKTIRFVEWTKPEDFQKKLVSVLVDELGLSDESDVRGFNRSMGCTTSGDFDYFNASRNGQAGAVSKVEAWQILSPLRGNPFGANDINRQIHERYRAGFLELATKHRNRKVPKPMGSERIVYGDKVINVRNHGRKDFWPDTEEAQGYLANGEIGIAIGQWRTQNMKKAPWVLKVEFSSQQGISYDFKARDFQEEGEAVLELAYALTVHKAQGSQFGLVVVVVPEGHPIISRELVYTALTRHETRVVVMHQGPRTLLKNFTEPHSSETARRRTNLVAPCRMVEAQSTEKGSSFLQENLIHLTSRGTAVRSKSELLIAEALINAQVDFGYERPLTLGGVTRYPDFTIVDDVTGKTIYWEHLGMLERSDYRRAWEKKLAWYHDHGVLPHDHPDAEDAVLITTKDTSMTGIDMSEVKKLIEEVCGG